MNRFDNLNQSMNLTLIIFVGIALIALIVFLIMRNQKDRKQLEHDLNNDYPKTKDKEGDIETD